MTQIEAAMPVTKTNSFILTFNGCGGEHTMGTIKNEIAKYWQCEGEEFFEEYMFSWDKDEIAKQYSIPGKYHLRDWNELDDLCHLNGPEFIEDSTYFELIDIDTQESLSEILIKEEMLEIEDEPEVSQDLEKDVSVLYGQQYNKGSFSFGPIESDQPFDPSKLRIKCSCWDDIQIITAIEYQGEIYYVEEESRGKSQTIYFA